MDVAEGEKVTATSVCADAVDYLFEGTEATQDILDTAVSAKMRMCREVMKWFMDDFTGKTRKACRSRQPKGRLSDLYGTMLKYHGILPNDLAKQDPRLLLAVIIEDEEEEYTGNDPYLKMFYGM